MKKVIWEMQYLSLLPVLRYCKKCREKTEFICSEQFRINANRKLLDIWLIYKCSNCAVTWNATIYSCIGPQSLNPELLDRFYENDKALVEQYAMNSVFLHGNNVEVGRVDYIVSGNTFFTNETVELEIKSKYSMPIKVSSIVRRKLNLSQREYSQLITNGTIRSIPVQDLQKCKLNKGIILVFEQNSYCQ